MRVVASSLRVAPRVSGTDLPGNLSGSRRLLFSLHPYSAGLASPVGSVLALFQVHRNNLCPFDVVAVVLHGGREAQLRFLIVARGYFSSSPLMRIKALYLASFMSDVIKPYIEQTNDVTPGMSTSMNVSDRKAVTCQSDISATSRWNGFNFPFLKKHNVKSQQPRSMHAYQAVLPSSQPVSRSEWQQFLTQLCIVDDFQNRSRG